jgi:outer membrane protein assembly factor BamC
MLNKNNFRLNLMGLMLVSGCANESTHAQAHDEPSYANEKQSKQIVVPVALAPIHVKESYIVPEVETKQSAVGLAVDIRPPMQIIPSLSQTRLDINSPSEHQIVVDVVDNFEDVIHQLTTATETYFSNQAIAVTVSEDKLSWKTAHIVYSTPSNHGAFKQQYVVDIKPSTSKNMVRLAIKTVAHEVVQAATTTVSPLEKQRHPIDILNGIVRTWDQQIHMDSDAILLSRQTQGLDVAFLQDEQQPNRWRIQAGFQQTWQLLPKALQSLHFKIEDLDYQKQKYYVKYMEEDGWFNDKTWPLENHKIYLFQVITNPKSTVTDIQFLKSNGQPVDAAVVEKMSEALIVALKQQARMN